MLKELTNQLKDYFNMMSMLDDALMITATLAFGSLMFVIMGRKSNKKSQKKKKQV